ncbi:MULTISPECIES: PAS domain-containing protein [unclassified Campylobacter]|uniref:PAS domain-containing protein n=1 Tax=unclassified Campylobacter TaxID=2593542 RepID=UPI0012382A3E|nr:MULTISPECIES: PAS domain-containing protein [unclassified Campylobacter]KAA6224806.1 PAS domain-containing protein [Campylobacter sp. LR185c]KAA6227381.1 PAS domain-containing protein [Campylobacter sp. LR196d]KAA6228758.1 PAS domain-containing protein [Campylobacter sp. LR286c]KAA6229568.1 PAS domain-containing protein [Campylobacter sp. LR264d]KAA6230812.1 PAS domain-containing protein [Campylobacter sp. LR291e]
MDEIIVADDTLITSKTNLKGDIIYANSDFLKYAGYTTKEILYKPHNIVRHKDMPKAVFKCLWDYIKQGNEIFAFVKNKAKSGQFYWVFANITASFNESKEIINYYSVRRAPNRKALPIIEKLYSSMLEAESKGGIKAGVDTLLEVVNSHKMTYNQLILHLQKNAR